MASARQGVKELRGKGLVTHHDLFPSRWDFSLWAFRRLPVQRSSIGTVGYKYAATLRPRKVMA